MSYNFEYNHEFNATYIFITASLNDFNKDLSKTTTFRWYVTVADNDKGEEGTEKGSKICLLPFKFNYSKINTIKNPKSPNNTFYGEPARQLFRLYSHPDL